MRGTFGFVLAVGVAVALVMAVPAVYNLLGPGGWHFGRNDHGEIREIARTDQGIELRFECGGNTHLHYSGSVPFVQGAMLYEPDLPVHVGYWACAEYSCYMRNGDLDELVATVDQQRFTYIFRNDKQISVTYDFRSLRPMLRELKEACRASRRRR